jgi:hypothetical protein
MLDVFGKGIEIRPLKAPGICFICEATPVQDSERVINTMRIFSPGPLTNLNGTKYVCESCAHDLGVSIGLVDPEVHQEASDRVALLEAELKDATDRVAAFSALESAVAALTVATTPAPTPDPVVDPAPAEVPAS